MPETKKTLPSEVLDHWRDRLVQNGFIRTGRTSLLHLLLDSMADAEIPHEVKYVGRGVWQVELTPEVEDA